MPRFAMSPGVSVRCAQFGDMLCRDVLFHSLGHTANDVRVTCQHSQVGMTEPFAAQRAHSHLPALMLCPDHAGMHGMPRVESPAARGSGAGRPDARRNWYRLALRVCKKQPERIGPPPGPVIVQHVHQRRQQRQITHACFRFHCEQPPAPVALPH
jgi:hypothetical protein